MRFEVVDSPQTTPVWWTQFYRTHWPVPRRFWSFRGCEDLGCRGGALDTRDSTVSVHNLWGRRLGWRREASWNPILPMLFSPPSPQSRSVVTFIRSPISKIRYRRSFTVLLLITSWQMPNIQRPGCSYSGWCNTSTSFTSKAPTHRVSRSSSGGLLLWSLHRKQGWSSTWLDGIHVTRWCPFVV